MVAPKLTGSTGPLTWQVEAELLNGPWLLLGQALPLCIRIKKLHGEDCKILLHDFQTILIETTQVHARGSVELFKRSWVIQTMANMEQKICNDDSSSGAVTELSNEIWASHALPSALTSSFEICNIKRNYQLEVHLGLQIELSKVYCFHLYCLIPNYCTYAKIFRKC